MKRCVLVVALGLLAGWLLLTAGQGQSPSDPAANPLHGVQIAPGGGFPGAPAFGVVAPGVRTRSEISRLVAELRDATDEAKKAEITKKLETAVTKAFDDDQKTREAELAKLEERLKKLRGQLDRRGKAKADIIQLQLKVLVNEAEGLGFSGTPLYEPSAGAIALPGYPLPALAVPAPAKAATPRLP
jgi:hypothetical protein